MLLVAKSIALSIKETFSSYYLYFLCNFADKNVFIFFLRYTLYRKGYEYMFPVILLDLELVFTSETKLFWASLLGWSSPRRRWTFRYKCTSLRLYPKIWAKRMDFNQIWSLMGGLLSGKVGAGMVPFWPPNDEWPVSYLNAERVKSTPKSSLLTFQRYEVNGQ